MGKGLLVVINLQMIITQICNFIWFTLTTLGKAESSRRQHSRFHRKRFDKPTAHYLSPHQQWTHYSLQSILAAKGPGTLLRSCWRPKHYIHQVLPNAL